jgi:hypothetical protein
VPPATIADSDIVEMRLPVGTHVVGLSGVAGNCAVEAVPYWGTSREVQVREGASVDVRFAISCEPIPTARLATWGIYAMDADGSKLIRLSNGTAYDREPWSPDGQRIAYTSRCAESQCVVVAPVEQVDRNRTLVGPSQVLPDSLAWSPDGARLSVTVCSGGYWLCDVIELAVMKADGTGMSALASSGVPWCDPRRTRTRVRQKSSASRYAWINAISPSFPGSDLPCSIPSSPVYPFSWMCLNTFR